MKGTPMALPARRRAALTGLVAMTLLLAACGGAEEAGDGEAVSARPAQEKIMISSTDAATPFALQAGRYKFGWDASGCNGVSFVMTGQTQGFTWEKTTLQKKFSSIVSDVLEDTYTLAQTDAACTEWTVQIDRIGN
jgi:hypothetical protein